jgi:hypothetical protein
MPGKRDFSPDSGSEADSSGKIVDSAARFEPFLPPMALKAPYLPPKPLRPRAFGGKGAEGMKKEITGSNTRCLDRGLRPSRKP